MLNIKLLSKPVSVMLTILALTFGAGISVAQQTPDEVITVVDPATGRVIEAPKHFSEMSEEEKAAYTEEDLKILESHEAELKKMMDKSNY
ncbi:MAG: hypothetical protein KTR16_10845 [Acidiferrobacterales bacterium]|nr:hypothetical protein [Acidiferrobacterales bacterium]